jgi:AraC family transcriptional regulator
MNYSSNADWRDQVWMTTENLFISRRVERAKQLLQGGGFSLAEVAAHAGLANQSQFSQHFKRLVGVTPGQFRTPSRIA